MYRAQEQADVSWLFETGALEIAPAEQPFLYTSGLIGPYYVNTHYLCGGKKSALALLDFIDAHQNDAVSFPRALKAELEKVHSTHSIYRCVIEMMASLAREAFPIGEVTHISGGQRRDWFFAPLLAEALNKPPLYLYNDLSIIGGNGARLGALPEARVLNAADLLTVGSSYTTKWIPALRAAGGQLCWSLNGVDRKQGGSESLLQAGLQGCVSLFSIEEKFFRRAAGAGLIEEAQLRLVLQYLKDPFEAMRSFLMDHPEFIQDALASSDDKKRARASLLAEQDLYHLGRRSH